MILISLIIGLLIAISIRLLLSQHLMRWLFGIIILSSTINLVILVCGRLTTAIPPILVSKSHSMPDNIANPLPQALILTAIVIGFGLFTFALILVRTIWQRFFTLNSDLLESAEAPSHDEEK